MDFSEIVQTWIDKAKTAGIDSAHEFYWEKVFPHVRSIFVARNRDLGTKYEGLMVTVGMSAQPIILTLEAVEPKKIYFLYTNETEKTLEKVIEQVDFLRKNRVLYDRDLVDPDDPLQLYVRIGEKWKQWKSSGIDNIAIDNTGGKKSMVSACAVAAYFLGIDLLYVDHGEYLDGMRMPYPGTEFLNLLPNPLVALGELKLSEVKNFFNSRMYERARMSVERLRQELSRKQALSMAMKVEIISHLIEGYLMWDRFHFGKAMECLKRALAMVDQYDLRDEVDMEGLERNLEALKVLGGEGRGKTLFVVFRDDPHFGIHLCVDLYCNALRKRETGLLDDSVVRLYRCLEMISQLRLAQVPSILGGPYNTDMVYWNSVPTEVRERFLSLQRVIYDKQRGYLPENLGLMNGHILLFALGDDLWKDKNEKDLMAFNKQTKKRNELMLIQGKQRASDDDIRELESLALDFLRKLSDIMKLDFDRLLAEHDFIRL